MGMNIYMQLTRQFNEGRLRAILSSGQAVVLHHLAIMSKDGDWLLREDGESMGHVLGVLDSYGARYRFGAPLDTRWMAGGWSAHFEFMAGALRVRTDFVCRPPRITPGRLCEIWTEQESRDFPFVDLIDLIELKKTNREKDYAIIGEIARRITDIDNRLRFSRSARELNDLCSHYPRNAQRIARERAVLLCAGAGVGKIGEALDAERRMLIHENEKRLRGYLQAATQWAHHWKSLQVELEGLSLPAAHNVLVQHAEELLPVGPDTANGGDGDD